MVEIKIKRLSQEQLQVEEFWKSRAKHFSQENIRRICEAYKKHIVGTTNYHEMGLVHSGTRKAKEDYTSFYSEVRDIIRPTDEELEILIKEGFDFVGLIALLDKIPNPHSHAITINMMAYK